MSDLTCDIVKKVVDELKEKHPLLGFDIYKNPILNGTQKILIWGNNVHIPSDIHSGKVTVITMPDIFNTEVKTETFDFNDNDITKNGR